MRAIPFILFVCLFFSIRLSAQTKADQRIIDVFGNEKVSYWQKNSPDSIGYYTFFITSAFEVYTPEYVAATNTIMDISSFPLSKNEVDALLTDLEHFNILPYRSYFDETKTLTYTIADTGYLLVFHPLNYIRAKFESGK